MRKVRTGLGVSLDGFISGPNDGPEAPDRTPRIGPGVVRAGHWWVQAAAYRAGAW